MEARCPETSCGVLVDSHAHVTDPAFDVDRHQVIARARERRVAFIEIGTDVPSSRAAVRLASQWGTYCAVGIHPHAAGELSDLKRSWEEIEELCQDRTVRAIGEIGLDYHFQPYDPHLQRLNFQRGLELAERRGLSVVVHQRDAADEVLSILETARLSVPVILHCFAVSESLWSKCLQLGVYIGLGGPVTYPKNEYLRTALRVFPQDKVIVESDCPYLPPQLIRGKRNEPMYTVEVARTIARVWEIDEERAKTILAGNAARAFGLTQDQLTSLAILEGNGT